MNSVNLLVRTQVSFNRQTDVRLLTGPPTLVQLAQVMRGPRSNPEGMRVIIHKPGTYPHVESEGFNVGNGRLGEFIFRMTKRTLVSIIQFNF